MEKVTFTKIAQKFRMLIIDNPLFWLSRLIDYPLIAPDSIQLNFLFRCNLSCRMCKMGDRDPQKELSLSDLKKIVNEASDLGVKEALILGGEPFLRPDLFDLIKHINSRKMKSIVVTNGTLLTEENLEKVKESKLFHIAVSLDAADDKTMSAIRGAGVFGEIIANVERFQKKKNKEKDFHTGISNCVTIMDQNIAGLFDIVKLSKRIGFYDVVFQPVVFDNTNQVMTSDVFDTRIHPDKFPVMEEAINRIIEFKKSGVENHRYIKNSIKNLELIKSYFKGTLKRKDRQCYAGFNRIQATQDSKIYFCVSPAGSHDVSFGNIRESNIKDVWYSAKAREYRKAIRKAKCCCMQRCAYRESFENAESILEKQSIMLAKALKSTFRK